MYQWSWRESINKQAEDDFIRQRIFNEEREVFPINNAETR